MESLETRTLLAGDPLANGSPLIISEIVADSTQTLLTRTRNSADESFDEEILSPDWIEILNVSHEAISLDGMHLTDDPARPTKWAFPDGTSIAAGGFEVVFASGDDIRDRSLDEQARLHTNFRLNGDGDFLALTNAEGAILHEFSPTFPPQRTDISYAVPMTSRTFLGSNSTVEYLVPQDNSLSIAWLANDFSNPNLVQNQTSPVGYDRGGGPVEEAETIGSDLVDRRSVDFSRGSVVVLESKPFTAAGRVAQWSFYSERTNAVTPLVFEQSGEEYKIVGIGRTRTSDGSGVQTFDFELQSGSDSVEASGFFFGIKDGDNSVDSSGVVEWDQNADESIRRYNGPLSGSIVADQQLTNGRSFTREFSLQATTGARLAREIATDVAAPMENSSSIYLRYPFDSTSVDSLRSLTLQMRYDDGFVAYLNGTEVARRNAPDVVSFDATATSNQLLKDANVFENINISQFIPLIADGPNVLAIHGMNDVSGGSEMVFDVRLTGLDIVSASDFGFATPPTPAAATDIIFSGFTDSPQFGHPRGFFDEAFDLQLSSPQNPDATIYYTTDGSIPGPENDAAVIYEQPVAINQTTTLRAASFREGLLPSETKTQTFLFPSDIVTQESLQPAVVENPTWGPQFGDSLRSLPSLSIVTPDAISVTNEVAMSAELIHPDGAEGFQVDAGIEVFGGTAVSFPKRSMRISFKNIYGPTTFEYDVFDDPHGVTQFDQLILRPGSHDTPFWNGSAGAGNYLRNRWTLDRQLEQGHVAPRGRFLHLYINGQYWGQYHLMERPNAAFMASHFGGSADDYDVLNAGQPIDGNADSWNALLDSLDKGYDEVKKYLDVVNYADYVLLQFFGGNNIDWRPASNWMAGRRRVEGAGFQFYGWDSDIVLRSGAETDIVNYAGPGFLWTLNGGVKQYPEFLDLLAERAQLHFFDDGMFTPEIFRQQIDDLANQTRPAIIAETARWGSGTYTPDSWEAAVQWMKDTYAPAGGTSRAETVIEQMRHAGLFPLVDAPQILVDGVPHFDELVSGTTLSLTAPAGDIYYTLDGSDPRSRAPQVEFTEWVSENAAARFLIPPDGSLRSDWRALDFDDTAWTEGINGVGFDTVGELANVINTNVEAQMKDVNATAYVRLPFTIDDPAAFDSLEFSIRYDDGFIAYLNGTEVARRNAGSASWNSRATTAHQNIEAIEFEPFNLTREMGLLESGENVLAIHAMNTEATNVDFLTTAKLLAGRTIDQGIAETAQRFSDPIVVPPDAKFMARTVWNSEWSPLRQAAVPTEPFPIRISEIMYHPAPPQAAEVAAGFTDENDFEFIELTNVATQTIDLSNVRLTRTEVNGQTDGVEFDFADSPIKQLESGQSVIVVEDADAFAARYGDLPVAGQWAGGLSNSSEQITLEAGDDVVLQFSYQDDWYPASDGDGYSLQIVDVHHPDLQSWSVAESWQLSDDLGGSPGRHADDTLFGDVNGDGVFDSQDLIAVLQAGEYEDDIDGNSTFEEGDWNGDGDFTSRDLVFAFQQGNFVDAALMIDQITYVDSLFEASRKWRKINDGDKGIEFA